MKNFCRLLLVTAFLSGTIAEVTAQTKAKSATKTSTSKKAGKGKNRRPKLIAYYESMMGRKLNETQKAQLRRAADDRERANKKFRSDVAKMFGTTAEAMATRERAYKKARAAKAKA